MTRLAIFFLALVILVLTMINIATPPAYAQATLVILDKNNAPITQLTDGDQIKIKVNAGSPADQSLSVSFTLDGGARVPAECAIAKGSDTCTTDVFPSFGWYWSKTGQPLKTRTIQASLTNTTSTIQVSPRPIVMAHGFASSADAWTNYLGPNSFLAPLGIRGFAVGDGQVPGAFNTGRLDNPAGKTNTIVQNAEILRDYIAAVKKLTGAQYVDLMSHSMGGLISRYYVDRLMPGRDVAQLIMLGPPNSGTDCANLPASLDLYLPATLEIRPSYVQNIFNRQITHRHGVPFSVIAGTQLIEPVSSPCTDVPSDVAIALASANGIPVPSSQIAMLHTDLNNSKEVFDKFIKPLVQRTEFPSDPDPIIADATAPELDFTRIYTGHVDSGNSQQVTIQIDNVTVANFALYDPTRSLTLTVRGATGNVVAIDATRNGVVIVNDPSTLIYLGYGFTNPRPGPWVVTLQSTNKTPTRGADYAITAQLRGGADLKARTSKLLPEIGEAIDVAGHLELGSQTLDIREAKAIVHSPDGKQETVTLTSSGNEWKAAWKPTMAGTHGIDLQVIGTSPDGSSLERAAFLSVDVQPSTSQVQITQMIVGIVALIIVFLIVSGLILFVRGRFKKRPAPV